MSGRERDKDRMQPEVFPLREILERQQRWNVPVYQRQYVWGSDPEKDNHLVPAFWEDVKDKALERIDGTSVIRSYFGAIICKSHEDGVFSETFDLVDGQQRITTFFLFLIALREVACTKKVLHHFNPEIDDLIFLPKRESQGPYEPRSIKLSPSKDDDQLYAAVARRHLDEVRKQDLSTRFFLRTGFLNTKGAEPILRAYWYLYNTILEFVEDKIKESKEGNKNSDADRRVLKPEEILRALLDGFLDGFEIIVIRLLEKDDAQGIFKALNGRSQPLSPFDLIRNEIFIRVRDEKIHPDHFFEQDWRPFTDTFWNDKEGVGQSSRPHSDHLIYYLTVAERGKLVNANRIVAEYETHVSEANFDSVKNEVQVLNKYAQSYRNMRDYASDFSNRAITQVAKIVEKFGAAPFSPVILWIDVHVEDDDLKRELFSLIGSYIARRGVCALSPKGYNKSAPVFIERMGGPRGISKDPLEGLKGYINSLEGVSTKMPTDADIEQFCETEAAYKVGRARNLNDRTRYILMEVERKLRMQSTYSEDKEVPEGLHIEHIMPQGWPTKAGGPVRWPLPNGISVASDSLGELLRLGEVVDPETANYISIRSVKIHTLGNLTLLTESMNPHLSNSSWNDKMPEISRHSTLLMNQRLVNSLKWDEAEIGTRARWMAGIISQIWPWEPPPQGNSTGSE